MERCDITKDDASAALRAADGDLEEAVASVKRQKSNNSKSSSSSDNNGGGGGGSSSSSSSSSNNSSEGMASVDQLTSAQKLIHEQNKNLFNIIKEHVKERSSRDMSAEEMQEHREMIIPLIAARYAGANGGHSAKYPYEFDESDESDESDGSGGSGGNDGNDGNSGKGNKQSSKKQKKQDEKK